MKFMKNFKGGGASITNSSSHKECLCFVWS
jgi:hypothetical protein